MNSSIFLGALLVQIFTLPLPFTFPQLQSHYEITVRIQDQPTILTFGPSDDFYEKALDFATANNLVGEGCKNAECTARFIEGAMRAEVNGGAGSFSKVEIMGALMEEEMHRLLQELPPTKVPPPQLSGPKIYGDVPCVPPFCKFPCSTIPLDSTCSKYDIPTTNLDDGKYLHCSSDNSTIYPISIGIPESSVVSCVPEKSAEFALQGFDGHYEFGLGEEQEVSLLF